MLSIPVTVTVGAPYVRPLEDNFFSFFFFNYDKRFLYFSNSLLQDTTGPYPSKQSSELTTAEEEEEEEDGGCL